MEWIERLEIRELLVQGRRVSRGLNWGRWVSRGLNWREERIEEIEGVGKQDWENVRVEE